MKSFFIKIMSLLLLFFFSGQIMGFEDHSFYSKEFNSQRFYRIYFPSSYSKNMNKHYPVIYYFHGWSGRYKWEAYGISHNPYYKGKARKHPPFIAEWEDYVKNHDAIIVTWDGYEPKYQTGKYERDGIKFGSCQPYDYLRAHNVNRNIRGLDYRKYFVELIEHIDSTYRTIPDRNHRAVTGLSMGGLMANYIAGQSKDYINSMSSFCPADNYPLFGIKGQQVVFPILEMYRSLKGIAVRLTMTDGDWLKYNDLAMNQLWSAADLTHYEFHVAHFRDHYAADTEEQLDFHMKHFTDNAAIPQRWNYVSPGYPSFTVFGYDVDVKRDKPALTLFEKMSKGKIKIYARTFLPEGPIVQKESIKIKTDLPYHPYTITAYNISNNKFSNPLAEKVDENRLGFNLNGGGYIVGINGGELGDAPQIAIVDKYNRDRQYFEVEKENELEINIVNVGNKTAENMEITATSLHPFISFLQNKIFIKNLKAEKSVDKASKIRFKFSKYYEEISMGDIILEIKVNGVVADTQKVIFYETPKTSYVNANDVIILDGRTVKNVPIFHQERDAVQLDSLSGGIGNGNGILEKGEDALIFVRIAKGISCRDTNSFHKTLLINPYTDKFVKVSKLKYDEKIYQAGATSVSSIISVTNSLPQSHKFDFWFKIESLYNDKNDPTAISPVYAFRYDYRRVKLETK